MGLIYLESNHSGVIHSHGSHAPILASAVAVSSGTILEAGIGYYSTPLLHAMAAAMGRTLYSLDSDEAWIKTLRKKFLSAAHQIYMRMETDWNQKKPPGLMFIDGTEGERVHDVRIAKAWQVPIVVVHDTEDEQAASYNWDGCLDGVRLAQQQQPCTRANQNGKTGDDSAHRRSVARNSSGASAGSRQSADYRQGSGSGGA